jgi:hypothetical protein
MDQKDMFSFFFDLKKKYKYNEEQIYEMLNSYDIGKLDISRIYRYLNKYLGIEIVYTDEAQTVINTNDAEPHDYQNEETIDE